MRTSHVSVSRHREAAWALQSREMNRLGYLSENSMFSDAPENCSLSSRANQPIPMYSRSSGSLVFFLSRLKVIGLFSSTKADQISPAVSPISLTIPITSLDGGHNPYLALFGQCFCSYPSFLLDECHPSDAETAFPRVLLSLS